jgi:hypothetical protein
MYDQEWKFGRSKQILCDAPYDPVFGTTTPMSRQGNHVTLLFALFCEPYQCPCYILTHTDDVTWSLYPDKSPVWRRCCTS